MTEMLALNKNWLDELQSGGLSQNPNMTLTMNITDQLSVTSGCYQTGQTWYYPWTHPVYITSPLRPIKLTLSEIDRLRKAAKADDKLKAILAKFTNQIEITVDFE